MARPFNEKDVQEYSKKVENTYQAISEAISYVEKYENHIKTIIDQLIEKEINVLFQLISLEELGYRYNYFDAEKYEKLGYNTLFDLYANRTNALSDYASKRVVEDVLNKIRSYIRIEVDLSDKSNVSQNLIKEIYLYFIALELKKHAEELKKYFDYSINLRTCIHNMENHQGFFSWIFTSSDRKELAEQSYNKLIKVYEGEDIQKVNDLQVEKIKVDKLDRCYNYTNEDYNSNSENYDKIINDFYPNMIKKTDEEYELPFEMPYTRKEVSELEKRVKDADDILERGLKKSEIYKDDVRYKIKAMSDVLIDNILKNTMPEELNRNKNGIRVKTLKEAGYRNMYKIYKASINNLSNIKGISETGAHTIKFVASNFVANLRKTMKIELSPKDKGIYSSRLAASVVMYIDALNLTKDIESIKNKKENVDRYLVDLLKVCDTIGWFCASTDEKKQAEKAYYYIKKEFEEDYGRFVEDTNKKLDEIADYITNYDYAWRRYASDPLSFNNVIEEVNSYMNL